MCFFFFVQKINELQQKVNRKQDELLPKKKFAFKSRKKTLPESKTTNGTNDTGSRNTDKISGKGFHDGDQVPKAEEYVSYLNKTTSNTVEIKDRQNEVISLQVQYYVYQQFMSNEATDQCLNIEPYS